jgi:hypothetical protein
MFIQRPINIETGPGNLQIMVHPEVGKKWFVLWAATYNSATQTSDFIPHVRSEISRAVCVQHIVLCAFSPVMLSVDNNVSFRTRSFPTHTRLTASKQSQEAVIKNLHETYQCRMYSGKLLMMGKEDVRNI